MAQEYLDRLITLMDRVSPGGFKGVQLECKHFFSGAAVYAGGRICMSWSPVGFAIKLPEASRSALISRQGAKYLRYFPKGPIKKDYVVLPEPILGELKAFRRWARVSVEYVLSLPAPVKRKKSHITRRSTRGKKVSGTFVHAPRRRPRWDNSGS